MGSVPLFPPELKADDADPFLSVHELRTSMPLPHEALPCSLSVVNLLWCSTQLMLATTLPLRVMCGIVVGSGVPKLRWVTTVGGITHDVVRTSDVVYVVVPLVGACIPLPLGGSSV
jgi:hypothetical protein